MRRLIGKRGDDQAAALVGDAPAHPSLQGLEPHRRRRDRQRRHGRCATRRPPSIAAPPPASAARPSGGPPPRRPSTGLLGSSRPRLSRPAAPRTRWPAPRLCHARARASHHARQRSDVSGLRAPGLSVQPEEPFEASQGGHVQRSQRPVARRPIDDGGERPNGMAATSAGLA